MAMTYDDRTAQKVEAGGSIAEAGGGIAIIVLTIISLAGGVGGILTAVAVIVLGASFIIEGGAVASEFARVLSLRKTGEVQFGSGLMAQMAGGASILVLGILAIVGVRTDILIPVAVIVGGALLLLTAGTMLEIHALRTRFASETESAVMGAGVTGGAGLQFLAGAAAIVLGIIGLTPGVTGVVLSTVGLLVLGGALTMNASAMTGNSLMGVFSR
jgi:hypothetical protein